MYTIKINGATFPKVIHFRTSESKLGQRLIIKQANGVKISLLVKDIENMKIERTQK